MTERIERIHGDTPTESTAERVHLPRLFVRDECIERCGKLATVAAGAVFEAAKDTFLQVDVVCNGKSTLFNMCTARTVEIGTYGNTFGEYIEGEEGYFLVDPCLHQAGNRTFTSSDEIEKALSEGSTPYSIKELK